MTANGTKPIESITVGEQVWTHNPQTDRDEVQPVTGMFSKTVTGLLVIGLSTGDTIQVTGEHPLAVAGLGWVRADELQPGDRLQRRDTTTVTVTRIEYQPGTRTVYNFETRHTHTYYATTLNLLTHNCDVRWEILSGIVRDAAKGKGNFGLGRATPEEAAVAGEVWVGEGARTASDGTTRVSSDLLRQWRPPTYKARIAKVQSNFESRSKPLGRWENNGHLDIEDSR